MHQKGKEVTLSDHEDTQRSLRPEAKEIIRMFDSQRKVHPQGQDQHIEHQATIVADNQK